ncbi:MAG TPA: hypothetical protein DEB37_18545, partial [Lysinibacillus sp.]|nr:hypothetical protein [Lysinibacillus sp.]
LDGFADATANLSLYGSGGLAVGGIRYLRNALRPGLDYGQKIGIIRQALQEKGNFGLGVSTEREALQLGKDFVGKGYRTNSDGSLASADGLREFRAPSYKPRLGKVQANFKTREVPSGKWQSNGHLDIKK